MGCGRISQRATQGSLYRGALCGRQRRSERLKVGPYAQGRWPCFFVTCDYVIPTPDCDTVGDGQRASRREACAYPDFMTGDSLFVKTCHYTRIGCDEISLAGFPREAPTVRPWAVYFLWPADHALFSSPGCDSVGAVPTGGPRESYAYPEFMTDGAWS